MYLYTHKYFLFNSSINDANALYKVCLSLPGVLLCVERRAWRGGGGSFFPPRDVRAHPETSPNRQKTTQSLISYIRQTRRSSRTPSGRVFCGSVPQHCALMSAGVCLDCFRLCSRWHKLSVSMVTGCTARFWRLSGSGSVMTRASIFPQAMCS